MHAQRTLLIVDGHRGVREALTDRLRHVTGVKGVAAAGDLGAALHLAHDLAPDVVLFEPRTIAGDAAEAVRLLRLSGALVVVLTSSLQDDEPASLQRAGAAAVLLKGTAFCELLATIEKALALAHGPHAQDNGAR